MLVRFKEEGAVLVLPRAREVRVMLVRGVEGGISTDSFEIVAPHLQHWKGWVRLMEMQKEQNKMRISEHTGHSKP